MYYESLANTMSLSFSVCVCSPSKRAEYSLFPQEQRLKKDNQTMRYYPALGRSEPSPRRHGGTLNACYEVKWAGMKWMHTARFQLCATLEGTDLWDGMIQGWGRSGGWQIPEGF